MYTNFSSGMQLVSNFILIFEYFGIFLNGGKFIVNFIAHSSQ